MSTECLRRGKLFGGCRFSPRYDLGEPNIAGLKVSGTNITALVEALKSQTYVRDVCERCGKTIERDS